MSFSRLPPPASVFDGPTAPVDESLVQRGEEPDGEARYAMLESMREFGLEMLPASGKEGEVRDAHAAWGPALAERAEIELTTPNQPVWFDHLVTETPNLLAALGWLVDVLRLPVEGKSGKERAATLFITRRTAAQYVSASRAKLGAPSRTAAAVRDGLV